MIGRVRKDSRAEWRFRTMADECLKSGLLMVKGAPVVGKGWSRGRFHRSADA